MHPDHHITKCFQLYRIELNLVLNPVLNPIKLIAFCNVMMRTSTAGSGKFAPHYCQDMGRNISWIKDLSCKKSTLHFLADSSIKLFHTKNIKICKLYLYSRFMSKQHFSNASRDFMSSKFIFCAETSLENKDDSWL